MRCRPATRATPILNSSSIRLRRRESVSLGRFQNCNLLEMDHFRRHGVEDEFRLLHTFLSPGPRGITPAFGYGAPHPSARGTSTLLNNALLSAHYALC